MYDDMKEMKLNLTIKKIQMSSEDVGDHEDDTDFDKILFCSCFSCCSDCPSSFV